MKVIERLSLVDRIGRELQNRMGFGDIDKYLRAHGVNTGKPTSGVNSKWVYAKDLLGDEADELVLRIADELEVPHNYVVANSSRPLEAAFWEPLHFKLFLSHLSSFKKIAGQLQAALRRYGISAFVAHVDIEPTREWHDEIEAGLLSMDALAAILMPGFKESDWTDQEIGVAFGRAVLVIPIMRGLTPYGFISKYQGLNAQGRTVSDVAAEVFRILVTSSKTRTKMLSCLIETTIQSKSEAEAVKQLHVLALLKDIPSAQLHKLQESAPSSTVLMSKEPLSALNELLSRHKLSAVTTKEAAAPLDDDIPF